MGEFQGIPDEYDGRVVTKTFTSVSNIPTFTPGGDAFIVFLPIPGYSYFYGSASAGTVTLSGIQSADYFSIFPDGLESTVVTSFRYAGAAMEIIPTVNAMSWTGSVQVFRGAVTLSIQALSASTMIYTIGGLSDLVYSQRPEAVHPFNMGCYCTTRPSTPNFEFSPVLTGTRTSEITVSSYSGAFSCSINGSPLAFTGLGNMEAIVYKIPAYNATGNLGTIRTWSNVEFQVPSSSLLYEYSRISPPEDKLALALARRAYVELQLCVPFYENDGTWEKIWGWAKKVSSYLQYVPGPVGEVAGGFSHLANILDNI